jgi:hypothetical protein
MKQIYPLLLGLGLFTLSVLPDQARAQCLCTGGTAPTAIVQTQNLSGTLPFTSTLLFNKFDPTTGNLNCVNISGTVTTTISMDLVNRDTTSRITYALTYTRVTSLTGPSGLSVSKNAAIDYGPYDLGQAGVDPDTSVHMGPDMIFNATNITKTVAGSASYQGAPGSKVSITYFNNGSFLMTQGNDNYGLDVAASSIVSVTLTYYYCPLAVLAKGLSAFSLTREGHNVVLGWKADNEVSTNRYTIEMSRNGKDFQAVSQQPASTTASAAYNFTYQASPNESGKLYFRIKKVDASGNVTYSDIHTVSFSDNGSLAATIYPNPAGRNVQVQFETLQTGTLDLDLVNTMGQILQHQTVTVDKASVLPVQFHQQTAKGLYWLRVGNRQTGERSMTRVTIL